MMHIVSAQLGPLEVPEAGVIKFPYGILGFPSSQEYVLLEVKPGSRFTLMQSTSDPKLAFVVMDPLQLDPQYPMDAVHSLAAQYGILPDEPLGVASIVTVPALPGRPTANLLAPLAMGMTSRLGFQIVLHDTPYQVRHAL